MAELTPEDIAHKLLTERFRRSGPEAEVLSDPLTDTPMTVTLDQLLPYDLNPRVTRNPRYEDIKASIHRRGLDAPPAITRRPGDSHYLIRNGGNTRLAILNELWAETKDESFFRIQCLFRPWPSRGEIVALTGHLAENELHGGLTFIERALGVEQARTLYEQEADRRLSQSELARWLSADGYPISQSQISRMQDTIQFLLPAIPTVLYGGLGRPQIERLTALRKAAERVWDARSGNQQATLTFPTLFHDVLALFDNGPETFSIPRVQDELIGQLAELLDADYDTLALEMLDTHSRPGALIRDPLPEAPPPSATTPAPSTPAPKTQPEANESPHAHISETAHDRERSRVTSPEKQSSPQEADTNLQEEHLQGHIVSPATTTERLQAIQRLVADQFGETVPDFPTNVVQAVPVQAGGLYPISDVWYIEPSLDAADPLRVHLAQLAREIAEEVGFAERIEAIHTGLGYVCRLDVLAPNLSDLPLKSRSTLVLLHTLSQVSPQPTPLPDGFQLTESLGVLLQGQPESNTSGSRISDVGLVKLFRLVRLARRLLELESDNATDVQPPIDP